jgi:hypothetical protein
MKPLLLSVELSILPFLGISVIQALIFRKSTILLLDKTSNKDTKTICWLDA